MKIAIYGKLRSGKSAVSEYIRENFENVEHLEFGSAVQEVCDLLYSEKIGVKNRKLLVDIGQHLRKYDKDIWVNIIKQKILKSKADHILVAGVRQENEYDMLRELGFIFVRVESSKDIRIERSKSSGDNFNLNNLEDPTELVMDRYFFYDYIIENDRGFKELEISINNTINSILSDERSRLSEKQT